MSVVKIFLPQYLFYNKVECEIFGEIQISENFISYFVVSDENTDKLRHLGYIAPIGKNVNKDVSMNFAYDALSATIYLTKLNIKTSNATVPNIFLYDGDQIIQLQCPDEEECKLEQDPADMQMLYSLLQKFNNQLRKTQQKQSILVMLCVFIFNLIHKIFSIVEYKPMFYVFNKMALSVHYTQWKVVKSSRKRTANIFLDKLLGIAVMLTLLFIISRPGDHLIRISHVIIIQLRQLLDSLKGSPIGLKLNVHLNSFFLDCFTYYIDLWATFLDLIEPIVRQLFVPIALLGVMGLSFQLALLADLISIVGLHAHSFYIYAAVLYKTEIRGLQILLKVVLGKRWNPLKNRVESHEYMNRQLYLATMFFASLVFLLPTILVYYIVFATLRMVIYLATAFLQTIQRTIIEFPLEAVIKWSLGHFYEIGGLELQYVDIPSQHSFVKMSVFEISVKSSSFPRIFATQPELLKKVKPDEEISFKNIVAKVLKGTI